MMIIIISYRYSHFRIISSCFDGKYETYHKNARKVKHCFWTEKQHDFTICFFFEDIDSLRIDRLSLSNDQCWNAAIVLY